MSLVRRLTGLPLAAVVLAGCVAASAPQRIRTRTAQLEDVSDEKDPAVEVKVGPSYSTASTAVYETDINSGEARVSRWIDHGASPLAIEVRNAGREILFVDWGLSAFVGVDGYAWHLGGLGVSTIPPGATVARDVAPPAFDLGHGRFLPLVPTEDAAKGKTVRVVLVVHGFDGKARAVQSVALITKISTTDIGSRPARLLER